MSVITFQKDQFQKFVSTKEFALNFDDKSIKSVKIRINDELLYDGETAEYKKPDGSRVFGKVGSLKTAIIKLGWLVLAKAETKASGKKQKVETPAVERVSTDYDSKRGGNFNTFVGTKDNNPVANTSKIIKEEDLVVKRFTTEKPVKIEQNTSGKLEVAGDQVAVKERMIVNSSTSVTKNAARKPIVTRADEMGSNGTIPLARKASSDSPEKKKKAFTVDSTTPRITEDATLSDVKRATEVLTTESQEAQVVGKINRAKLDVQEVEGVTLKKTAAPKDMVVSTKTGPGSTPVADASSGVVVAKTKVPDDKISEAAKARAEARKKAAAQTQAQIELEKKVKPVEAKTVAPKQASTDYHSMLPEDWGKMHWVKKEKFIKALTDKGLIEFIQSVETTKAVLNACVERLKELQ